MSSLAVRTLIKNFLTAEAPTEKLVDLTGQIHEVQNMLSDSGVGPDDPWIGVQFVGADEVPSTTPATNDQGKYWESGAVYIHVVGVASLGISDSILGRAENLRNLFRGRRIGAMFIDSVTPINFDAGAALRFESGYIAGAFILGYRYEINL